MSSNQTLAPTGSLSARIAEIFWLQRTNPKLLEPSRKRVRVEAVAAELKQWQEDYDERSIEGSEADGHPTRKKQRHGDYESDIDVDSDTEEIEEEAVPSQSISVRPSVERHSQSGSDNGAVEPLSADDARVKELYETLGLPPSSSQVRYEGGRRIEGVCVASVLCPFDEYHSTGTAKNPSKRGKLFNFRQLFVHFNLNRHFTADEMVPACAKLALDASMPSRPEGFSFADYLKTRYYSIFPEPDQPPLLFCPVPGCITTRSRTNAGSKVVLLIASLESHFKKYHRDAYPSGQAPALTNPRGDLMVHCSIQDCKLSFVGVEKFALLEFHRQYFHPLATPFALPTPESGFALFESFRVFRQKVEEFGWTLQFNGPMVPIAGEEPVTQVS
ncbi:hypothetical protein BJ508DRAFT_310600 [Ascobolus immersus RN42]|uniref:Uncharacterized protein n=1 Tax=Ascobolus immersus RN42 TaxID=1160509 RepID=A0A3N4HSY7_ASCIM|nr:hypothetical protein BJ508DRAFT_310600 [Ascobolus immersus RN42]